MLNPPVGVQTQDYIDALKADSPVHVRMSFTAQGITLTDQDIMINDGLTLSDILNGDIDLTFGRAVMKQLTVGVLNSSRVAHLLWTDEFTLELGVDINGTTQYVKIGDFIGEKPNNITNVSVIEYTAYDKMQKFDTLADDFWNSVTFPATVSDIYHDLCTYVGIGYVSGDELPYIMSRTFTTAPIQLQGYTCRDLLAWIAEAAGCYAKVNADGNCKMVWYTDHSSALAFALDDEFHIETADLYTGLIWDEFDEYFWDDADKLAWNDVCGYEEVYGLDSIMVKQLDSDADVCYPYASGGNVYMIVENPFLSVESADDIENFIKPLWDRLSAFGGHLPINVECVGNWLVESGDIISVDVTDTMTVNAPVYIRTMKWNGSCRDVYETTGTIRRQEVSSDNRVKLISRNNIRFVAKDLYYNIQSGIDIKPEGIEIVGNKYLKLESGGVLDVQASNFVLNSLQRKMITGDWEFDSNGVQFKDGEEQFNITQIPQGQAPSTYVDSNGIFYDLSESQYGNQARLLFSAFFVDSNDIKHNAQLWFRTGYTEGTSSEDVDLSFYLDSPASNRAIRISGTASAPITSIATDSIRPNALTNNDVRIYPNSNISIYGYIVFDAFTKGTAYYTRIYTATQRMIYQGYGNVGQGGMFFCYPRGLDESYIVFQQYTYNSNKYTKIYGSVGANMIFEGVLQAPSSREIKHDIKPLGNQGELIDSLKPVSFVYDNDPAEQTRKGLIYEDTMEVAPEICSQDESSKAIRYGDLIPVLLKEIQDLRARVKTLEERLGEQ